jgi:hypothetical protein
VGKTGRLTEDNPDPGSPVATRREVLDPTVVEASPRTPAIFGEDLGEVSTTVQRPTQNVCDYRFVDQG